MFALVMVAGLCYLAGGMGVVMSIIDSNFGMQLDQSIMILLAGILFHAASQALDYLKEIRDSLQKIDDK